ncbi:MAG: ATP-binding cassette domain-containing protein [Calditrichia bacterium]
MEPIIIDNITKRFDEKVAVDQLSLTVPSGVIYAVIGPNGAGKSTTLRMLLNILLPDEGRIEVLGTTDVQKILNKIGYLPEERGLYQKMKVIQLLQFMGELKGLSASDAKNRGFEWLKRLDIREWANKKVEELSKGMQQKVQFIGTIIHDPEIVILDEPFSGLDPVNMEILKELILEMKENNKTVLYSTHVMDQAEKLSDYICLINDGKVVLNGELQKIKQEYGKNKVVLELKNGEKINWDQFSYVEQARDFGNYFEVKLTNLDDSQKLLKDLMSTNSIEIYRFQTSQSSLHEIFVEMVGGTKE